MATDSEKFRFRFRQFGLNDRRCGMKIGTDAVLLGAWASLPHPAGRIHDAGAGCGIIGLMLAQRFPEAEVCFSEMDEGAFSDLNENVASSPWASRCETFRGDFTKLRGPFSLIVSNPPFFTEGERAPESARAAARHAGALSALTLPDYAAANLLPDGVLSMIFPATLLDAVEEKCAYARLNPLRICTVSPRPGAESVRVMAEFSPAPGVRRVTSLTIRDAEGHYTSEYVALTRDFYLHLH